jgi:hypothetical protein
MIVATEEEEEVIIRLMANAHINSSAQTIAIYRRWINDTGRTFEASVLITLLKKRQP